MKGVWRTLNGGDLVEGKGKKGCGSCRMLSTSMQGRARSSWPKLYISHVHCAPRVFAARDNAFFGREVEILHVYMHRKFGSSGIHACAEAESRVAN